ncbi:MAG: sensor histidine kinase, partial [Bacteroidia bacterium]|nr:sensor histidine kinase [Bacteroidia bacterium]
VKLWAYDSLKDYKNAARTAELTYNMVRETFPLRLDKSVGRYKALFDLNMVELKNQELELEQVRQENKFNRLLAVSLGLVLLTIMVVWFLRSRIHQKKAEINRINSRHKDQLIAANFESEERERKRIARELHDDVGQQITSIKLGLESLPGETDKVNPQISQIKGMVENALDSVRGLSHQMMPTALDRFGLLKGVEALVESTNTSGKLNARFENFNVTELHMEQAIQVHLYRIVQQLLSNLVRHAQATNCLVQVYEQEGKLILMVTDDGIGFDAENQKESGIGLSNIESRALSIGARFEITSGKDGTTAIVTLPFEG